MDFTEVRRFLLASYHDLPNVLFVGSLILGALLGYLPLVWLALGMVLNAVITFGGQSLVKLLLKWPAIDKFKGELTLSRAAHQTCFVGFKADTGNSLTMSDAPIAAPSYWLSAAAFFAVFSIYNSIRVTARDPRGRVDPLLVSARKAFSISTLIMGIVFIGLILARGFTGCETRVGGVLGFLVGTGVAIGFWHLLDSCGTGKLPDILQVVGSMAPDRSKTEQPVMCTASA